MTQSDSSTDQLKQPVEQAAAHPWFGKLARWGYAAKGLVYLIVGLLALQGALRPGAQTPDNQGALRVIIAQPFGKFLLAIVAIGLIGYALFRLVEAILDPEHHGRSDRPKRIVKRIGYAMSAIAYTGLALTAFKLIIGSATSNNNSTQDWTARLLAQPFGQILVGLVGIIVIGVGLSYLYRAYKIRFRRHFDLQDMDSTERAWVIGLGRFGIAARGVVFALIGIFLIQAARQSDASEAKGLGETLSALAQQPFGPWLLGVVALGLAAYGFYSILEAKYRCI